LTRKRWVAVLLLTVSFAVPNLHVVHATDGGMQMDAEMMPGMDCMDGSCEESPQSSCVEHCLRAIKDHAPLPTALEAVDISFDGDIDHERFYHAIIEKREESIRDSQPLLDSKRHLTIQKRE